MSELVNLKIDGKPVAVPRGTLVVDAAAKIGIEIPVFCYHPKLEPVGACRMCLVEMGTPRMGPDRKPVIDEKTGEPQIAMMPKLQTACTSPVSEGMVVLTRTAQASGGRRAVLEFLLTNHPLDCPVCDKGGECPLQDNTFKYGPSESRFVEAKRHYQKPIPLSDRVVLDRERCILCYRCVRFQREIAGDESLTTLSRGSRSEIGVAPGTTFDSIFSGNTIEMCPVGALTSSKYRFKARPWDIKHIPSVCAECSVGCNTTVDIRQNDIVRIMSRENDAVDDGWLCDRGRFSFDYVHADGRLERPLVRRDGQLVETSWEDAYRAVASRLRFAAATYGADAVAGIAGAGYTNEDMYLFGKLFRQVLGSGSVDHAPRPAVAPIDATLDAVRGSIEGLERASVIVMVGGNPIDQQPVLDLRLKKAITKKGAKLILIHPERIDLAQYATVWLKPAAGGEARALEGLLRALADIAEPGTLPKSLLDRLADVSVNVVAGETEVPAHRFERAAALLKDAKLPALLYPREFPEGWRAGLTALTELAVKQSAGDVSFVGGLVRFANSQGALDQGLLPAGGIGDSVAARAAAGTVKALWVLGANAVDPALLNGVECLIVQDIATSALLERADIVLPGAAFAEKAGTLTNLERRIQRLTPARLAPGLAREDWRILIDVARQLGATYDYATPREVLREIAQANPRYAGITWERVGKQGQQWDAPVAAPQPEPVAAD